MSGMFTAISGIRPADEADDQQFAAEGDAARALVEYIAAHRIEDEIAETSARQIGYALRGIALY